MASKRPTAPPARKRMSTIDSAWCSMESTFVPQRPAIPPPRIAGPAPRTSSPPTRLSPAFRPLPVPRPSSSPKPSPPAPPAQAMTQPPPVAAALARPSPAAPPPTREEAEVIEEIAIEIEETEPAAPARPSTPEPAAPPVCGPHKLAFAIAAEDAGAIPATGDDAPALRSDAFVYAMWIAIVATMSAVFGVGIWQAFLHRPL